MVTATVDLKKKNSIYNALVHGATLSQKIVALVSIVVVLGIFPASLFTTMRVAKVIYDRVSINAVSINIILCHAREIVDNMQVASPAMSEMTKKSMLDYVNHVDDSDEASVAIFDRFKNLVVLYNPAGLPNFEGSARALVEQFASYDEITYTTNYNIPNKAIGFIKDSHNERIGFVVTGYSDELFNTSTNDSITFLGMTSILGLIVGIVGAIYLARHIKKILFGLEPEAIASLLQERNIILNSVREGVINVNAEGIITMVNSEAQSLLREADLPGVDNLVQCYAGSVLPGIQWMEILKEGKIFTNATTKAGEMAFMVTVVPIYINKVVSGAVMTFRRKSDVYELANQLTGFKNYATALRAQTHEFMNKMHVIIGLIDMGAYDELKKFTKEIAFSRQTEVAYVTSRLKDIALTGFVLGKIARSRELDIEFSLTEESELRHELAVPSVHDLVLIIGNLVENAFDALRDGTGEKLVSLSVLDFDQELVIEVEDNGQGISKDRLSHIFDRGYSSKGGGRGFGLYLVKHSVEDLNGTISVESDPGQGTIFTVRLPMRREGEIID